MIIEGLHTLLNRARHSLASPSRTPRMAVVVGRLLGLAFLICFGTGIYSHFLQDPLPWMVFPTRPIALYQISQGIHITAGILCFPLLFFKLYAVFPELFTTPIVKSFPHFLERASIAVFVAASLVQIASGLLNTFQWYALFPFPFRQTYYALSYVIIGSLAIHIAVKLPVINQYWRKQSEEQVPDVAETPVTVESTATGGSSSGGVTGRLFDWIDRTPNPAPPQASRRAFLITLGLVGGVLVVTTAGQSFRLFDATNIFGPRKMGIGPNDLPINRTAAAAKVEATASDINWTLTVTNGSTQKVFTRDELRALPQHRVDLPIACVEGWSQMASWKGPRLRDLVEIVGGASGASIRATSLEQNSSYAVMDMGPEYVRDELTLVALELNGETLDLDHGYPARMIAPGRPGVLQTKWLSTLEVI